MLDAVWSGARGWLTPPVLFVVINLVIGTIAVMSKLMSSSSSAAGDGDHHHQQQQRQSLMRAPSDAFDRLRCFSFSRLGLPASPLPHTPRYPAFDDDAAAEASPVHDHERGEWWQPSLLCRAPSVALDRLRGLSFSRRGAADHHAPATPPSEPATDDAAPSSWRLRPALAEMEREVREPEQTHIERSQSEAAAVAPARRRPRAKKTRMAARTTEERAADDGHGKVEATGRAVGAGRFDEVLPPAVEVDERADDFIRQFREQLRLQRIDSILRYKDTLRRTGTV
ncbi:hypothetical protein QOZ80_2BG0160160 [Eleusine coracana subsp. coracana]|nr:hypothetical protein QOZ80_2BG0160160 [Eleusine coracana subsp. coracana]